MNEIAPINAAERQRNHGNSNREAAGGTSGSRSVRALFAMARSFGWPTANKWGRTEAQPQEVQHMQNIQPITGTQEHPIIREGSRVFTPVEAAWIAREMGFSGNRKLSPTHVAKLAEYMRRGQWLDKSTLDFARLPNGILTLVNGHHRLNAQAETAVDVVWNIVIHDVPDESALRSLYYRFDTELRKRSAANVVGGVGLDTQLGLSKEIANGLWRAAPIIATGMSLYHYRQGKVSPLMDDMMKVCAEYGAQARDFQAWVSIAPSFLRDKMRRPSTFALAMVTTKFQPVKGAEFWRGVCEDDGLAKGDPRKTFLLDMQSRTGSGGLKVAHLMAGAKAWNAFFAGRQMQIIKVTGHSVRIDGTPFTVSA